MKEAVSIQYMHQIWPKYKGPFLDCVEVNSTMVVRRSLANAREALVGYLSGKAEWGNKQVMSTLQPSRVPLMECVICSAPCCCRGAGAGPGL